MKKKAKTKKKAKKESDAGKSCCPSLSYRARIIGFILCSLLGGVLNGLGVLMIFIGPIEAFAGLYSFGNIVAICATGFLVGPMRQLRQMVKPTRIGCTLVFIATFIATLVVAIKLKNLGLVIFLCCLQALAFFWYSISYIPFARNAIIALVKRITTC